MAKRFESIEKWTAETRLPKRVSQALLWTLVTDDPQTTNGPVLAVLAMAGQIGLTHSEIRDVLGADVLSRLNSLRGQGAIERGTGGVYRLKPNSSLAPPVRRDFPKRRLVTKAEAKANKSFTKRRVKASSGQIEALRARTRVRAAITNKRSNTDDTESSVSSGLSELSKEITTTTCVSENSEHVKPGGYRPGFKRPTRSRKNYSLTPSKHPRFSEWRQRKPEKWGSRECAGYWLHSYLGLYEIEDQQFVGASRKGQDEMAWGIWNFVKHERGLGGDTLEWKEYVDWLFGKFLGAADWLEQPIDWQKICRLPNGKQNYFLSQFRSRNAKVPGKKKRYRYERRHWGFAKVPIED